MRRFVWRQNYLHWRYCKETQMIEKELGRTQKSVNRMYSDRLIDIDLLLYEDLVLSVISASGVELTLPIR